MNYRFTDSDFPGGKGKPAWFHKTTPPQKRRTWFDEYNRRASNGEDNRGESHAPDTSTLRRRSRSQSENTCGERRAMVRHIFAALSTAKSE
jgi:hypothetical protein